MSRSAIEIGEAGRAVAANVRRLRKAQGLTGDDLANRWGRPGDKSAIGKIERAQRRVDVDDLVKLARILQVEPADLLSSPFICPRCQGAPPEGFACPICGASDS